MPDYLMNEESIPVYEIYTPEIPQENIVCKTNLDNCRYILPNSLTAGTKNAQKTQQNGWTHKKFLETDIIYRPDEIFNHTTGAKIKNIFHEYQLLYTLTGNTDGDDIEILSTDLPAQFELQRVNLHFSDNTMKTFSVNVYGHETGYINAVLMSYSNHYNQDYEDTVKRVFLMPNKININIVGTIYKKVYLTVQLKELFQFQAE